MLVISRQIGEAVKISNDVWLRVAAVNGNQVKLAFVAPKDVKIFREELTNEDMPTNTGR